MSKVLVESPRSGRAGARALQGSRRQRRQAPDRDGESAPGHIGMRRDALARKHFGEHLGPLFRYLRQQVQRPWSLVYGELCAQLDRRNVVQAHLFQHIEDRVALKTVWQDEQVWVQSWRGLTPLAEFRSELFVHPRTGLLLPNRAWRAARERQRSERRALAQATHPDRRSGLPGMTADLQWQRQEGIWYEVKLAALPAAQGAPVYDVLLKRMVDARQAELLRQTYGQGRTEPARYAVAKRQLGHAALRRHGLHGDPGA